MESTYKSVKYIVNYGIKHSVELKLNMLNYSSFIPEKVLYRDQLVNGKY